MRLNQAEKIVEAMADALTEVKTGLLIGNRPQKKREPYLVAYLTSIKQSKSWKALLKTAIEYQPEQTWIEADFLLSLGKLERTGEMLLLSLSGPVVCEGHLCWLVFILEKSTQDFPQASNQLPLPMTGDF